MTIELLQEDVNDTSPRRLATVSTIKSVRPVPDSERLDVVTFTTNGWEVVMGRNDVKPGDRVVFFEIDSFLPNDGGYTELEGRCNKVLCGKEGYRIRTVKLRGQISQGYAVRLHRFEDLDQQIEDGTDLTQTLNVKLWIQPGTGGGTMGSPLGDFPTHLIAKTDQTRWQSLGRQDIVKLFDYDYEFTEKCDGTSCTIFLQIQEGKPHRFGVCSRNLELKPPGVEEVRYTRPANDDEPEDSIDDKGRRWKNETKMVDTKSVYWDMCEKYRVKDRLETYCNRYGKSLAIQSEIVGPGTQKNPFGFSEVRMFIFDIFDMDTYRYIAAPERLQIIEEMNGFEDIEGKKLEHVPVIGHQGISPSIAEITAATQKMEDDFTSMSEEKRTAVDSWGLFLDKVIGEVTSRLLAQADMPGKFTAKKEGFVAKALQDPMKSFKVISNRWLLNEKD